MKYNFFLSFLCLLAILLVGCKNGGNKQGRAADSSEYYIYYLDNEETQVVREAYRPQGTTMEEQLDEYAEALREKAPSNLAYKKALPDYVKMEIQEPVENEQLTLMFNSGYTNLTGATEVLTRAAVVKTFCQVEGVEYVQFMVDGQPLKYSNDLPVAFMQAEDFIDNTGGETKYEQNALVVLYFADAAGRNLVDTRVKIKYDGTIPLEDLVVNQLIKGPGSIEGVKEGEVLRTVPVKSVLNKATVKDGICYIDFNKEFLTGVEGISQEVTIYSVVNSLIEIPEVNKVQITIEGAKLISSGDGIEMDMPIERNLDLVRKNE